MISYSDMPETKENAEIAVVKESFVERTDAVTIKMVPGGGFAARFVPAD